MKESQDIPQLDLPGEPSVLTPAGRIEQARRFSMGWRAAPRWKKRGLILTFLVPIALMTAILLIALLIEGLMSFFK